MGIRSLLRLEHIEIYDDTRRGKEKREKRRRADHMPCRTVLCQLRIVSRFARTKTGREFRELKGSCEGWNTGAF